MHLSIAFMHARTTCIPGDHRGEERVSTWNSSYEWHHEGAVKWTCKFKLSKATINNVIYSYSA